jgi:hypothetical protein
VKYGIAHRALQDPANLWPAVPKGLAAGACVSMENAQKKFNLRSERLQPELDIQFERGRVH